MELTPEERQRIYEEEKVRIEAQDRVRAGKRWKAFGWTLIGCVLILVVLGRIAVVGVPSETGVKSTPSMRPNAVKYYVSSNGPVEVSYTNETDGMNHERAAIGYWDKTLTLPFGATAYVTAQSQSDTGGRVFEIGRA